jgi:6-phosphogluconolactonase
MDKGVKREVRLYPDMESLKHEAAKTIADLIHSAVSKKSYFTIVLAGGRTPAGLYTVLAERFGKQILWPHVHIFWGDERYVPHNHQESNFAMAYKNLLSKIDIFPQNIHPIPTENDDPDKDAQKYEQMIREFFLQRGISFPCFDLVLLGVGKDGHTASLFPGDPALQEKRRWVAPVLAPADYSLRKRITLTLPAINSAANVIFIVSGSEKKMAVKAILEDTARAESFYPASMVRPAGKMIWFVDEKTCQLNIT